MKKMAMRLPGVEPGSIAWKAIILTVGLQTPLDDCIAIVNYLIEVKGLHKVYSLTVHF